MRPYYKAPRLYVDAPLQEGVELVLNKTQTHHLTHVLRLKAGAQCLLFNGCDGEWLARLVMVGKKQEAGMGFAYARESKKQAAVSDKVTNREGKYAAVSDKVTNRERRKAISVIIEKQTRSQPPASDLIYCFAPLKSARLDYMVQKATEMGAGLLQPVITQFTQITHINQERLQANIIEAAQQCGLLSLPRITKPQKLLDLLKTWPQQRHLIFCDEILADSEDDAILTLAQLAPASAGLLIGPEGGFSDEERTALQQMPFVTGIGLGPRILRADTAAVAALALINAVLPTK